MIDLVYVNLMVIAFDILQVIFVYINQLGISHYVASFSYILKLRLEFVVLNQLMDVAARGTRKTLEKNRYYHTANRRYGSSHDNAPAQEAKNSYLHSSKDWSKDPAQTTLAPSISPLKSTYQIQPTNRSGSDVQISGPEYQSESNLLDHTSIAGQKNHNNDGHLSTQQAERDASLFDRPPPGSQNPEPSSSDRSKDSKLLAFRRGNRSHDRKSGGNADDDDDWEEIELQMWERRGTAVVDVPWFRSKVEV